MQIINHIPFAALGMGTAFTVLWGVADPVAALAEVRVYTGVGTCALGDIGTPEQAKNLAKEKALQNAKEQAGVYLANYTKATNTHLAANEITTITNNIIGLVGEVKYQQTPGAVNGQPVIVYTATLQANVDTDGIQDWLSRDEKQRTTIIEQTEAAQAEIRVSIERIDRITTQYNQTGSEQEKEQLKKEYNEADKKLIAAQKNLEGVELNNKGDYDGAIRLFRESIALDSNFVNPWNNMGSAYGHLGDYNKGIECYRKAIELGSKYANPWSNMGYAYWKLGDYNKAIECCLKAIELDPKFAYPWNNMGIAYGELGDYNKEIECCLKAIELDPKFANPWNNMGYAYMELGDYNKAIECYKKAIELDPKDAYPWNKMGFAYYLLGNYPKAVECFQKALELKPGSELYQENLEAAKKLL